MVVKGGTLTPVSGNRELNEKGSNLCTGLWLGSFAPWAETPIKQVPFAV